MFMTTGKIIAIVLTIILIFTGLGALYYLYWMDNNPPPPTFIVNAGSSYNGKPGDSIQFYGTVSGGQSPYTYVWDLDGVSSTEENPTRTWNTEGTYTVTLWGYDILGNSDSDTATVYIQEEEDPPDPPPSGLSLTNTDGHNIGDEFWVTAHLDPEGQPINFWIIGVTYDSTIIEAQEVIAGDSIWTTLFYPDFDVHEWFDISDGEILNAGGIQSGVFSDYPTSGTNLFRIKFKAISSGNAEFNFVFDTPESNQGIYKNTNEKITVNIHNTYIMVE